ncbi:MAG: NACHT domain-containing protein [Caldilineaceae bacterium]|nr:NACHT domain-containing protein [Caldilineaceae bacterium]
MTPFTRPEDEFAAAGLTWLLETFVTPFVEAAKGEVKKRLDEHQEQKRWEPALTRYKESLLRHYGTLRVLGKTEDVPLGDVFTDVYLLDQLTAQRRFDIRELVGNQSSRDDLHRQSSTRQNGLGLVNQGKNLYILGKPGAGKTTFLKWITVRSIGGKLTNPRLPIFVSLHEWSNSRHTELLPFIVEKLAVHHFPEAAAWLEFLLTEGRALLLFDGLDEVRQENEQRARLSLLLKDFTTKYDRSQHLITCRVAASEYVFPGFQDVEVADFTAKQVRAYAQKWFGKQETKYAAFVAELEKTDHQGLRELCNVPLLLSMLCLYFDDAMTFPGRRAELYEDALDALLRKWDSSRQIQRDSIYQSLSHKRKQQMLAHIATPAFEKGEYYFTTRRLTDDLSAYLSRLPGAPTDADIDGEAVLRAIEAQHGVLVERARNIHSFSHLSFQEYFAARYIAENEARGATGRLIRDHLTDRRWREIFLLTVSMLDNADDFMKHMRTAVDHLIAGDAEIVAMLQWADKKATLSQQSDERSSAVRLMYFALARDFNRGLARDFDLTRDLDLDLALARDLGFAFVRDFDFDLALARALDRDFALARTIARDLALTRTVTRDFALARTVALARTITLDLEVGIDYGLYYSCAIATILAEVEWHHQPRDDYRQQWPALLDFCVQAHNQPLSIVLAELTPPASADNAAWQTFADALWTLLERERGFRSSPPLSKEQANRINNYLYANELLVRCLDLAYVSDRQGILNNLLLPPRA